MLASPDQIIRSTATNSTCRVATTLLGVHRPAVRVAASGAGHGDGSRPLYPPHPHQPAAPGAVPGLGRWGDAGPLQGPAASPRVAWRAGGPRSDAAAVQQGPAAHADPGTAHGRGRRP